MGPKEPLGPGAELPVVTRPADVRLGRAELLAKSWNDMLQGATLESKTGKEVKEIEGDKNSPWPYQKDKHASRLAASSLFLKCSVDTCALLVVCSPLFALALAF